MLCSCGLILLRREIVKRIDMWGIDMLFVVGGNGGNAGANAIQVCGLCGLSVLLYPCAVCCAVTCRYSYAVSGVSAAHARHDAAHLEPELPPGSSPRLQTLYQHVHIT